LGKARKQKKHDVMYWELGGRQGVRMGDWKAIRAKAGNKVELYNLADDIGEQNDLASKEPEVLAKMTELLTTARTDSDLFPLPKPKSKS